MEIKNLEKKIKILGNTKSLCYLYNSNKNIYKMAVSTTLTLEGRLMFLDETRNASKQEGKEFLVRTFGLDTSTVHNGTLYTSSAGFQLTGKNCERANSLNIGDKIEVDFSVSGTVKDKADVQATEKNPKSTVCYTNLNCYNIRMIEKAGVSVNDGANPAALAASVPDDLPF